VTSAAHAAPARHHRLAVLHRVEFRRLFLANLTSGVGTWLALLALQIEVYDRTHSGWWVGALLAANIVPAIAVGLLLGPLVDRLSRKGLMIVSDLGRMAVFAALPFVHNTQAIVALALVAGIGNAFFRPAVLAGVPNLVSDDDLPDANALLQFVDWGTTIVGSLAGGAIVALSGTSLAFWVNAVTFAISAVFVAGIPSRLLQSERPIGRGHWKDVREGFDTVLQSRELTTVLVAWTIAQIGIGGINLAEIFLARTDYDTGNFGFGVMVGASGVGLVIGGLWARSAAQMVGMRSAYPRALLVFAVGTLGAAVAPNLWVGAIALFVYGLGNGVAVVLNITLVQRGAPDRLRGRALTSIIAINYGVLLAVFVAVGPLTDAVGARVVYAIAAGALVVAAAAATLLLPREETAQS
jgi:MFS family permease